MSFRTRFARDERSTIFCHVIISMTFHALQHRAVLDESFALLYLEVFEKLFDQQSIRRLHAFDFHVQR
jgi:hypothetical protein